MARDQRPSGRVALTLTLVGLLLSFNTAASAQGAGTYVSLVERYAGGDATGAVMELARWNGPRVTDAIDEWMQTLSSDQRRAAAMPQTLDQLRQAVMMHTDLAYVWLAAGQASPARMHVQDANRLVTFMLDSSHGTESIRTFAIRWYAFAVSIHTSQGRFDAASLLVQRGLTTIPRAAELYIARGNIQEMRANIDDSDDLRRGLRDSARPGARPTPRVTRLLDAAATDFQHALDLDRSLATARLHRGWVHHLLDDNRASQDLEAALNAATDDSVRYLAHLFLGAVAEHRNDLEAARREFEAAKALGPYQTSYVALGHVEDALGHRERARDIAMEYLQLTDKMDDPWWDFRVGFDAAALTWLRQETRRR